MAALGSSLSSLHLSAALFISSPLSIKAKAYPSKRVHRRRLRVTAATEGSAKNPRKSKDKGGESGEDPSGPSWAQPGSDELPPWARQESQKETSSFEIPFYAYLIASSITAIAAVITFIVFLAQLNSAKCEQSLNKLASKLNFELWA